MFPFVSLDWRDISRRMLLTLISKSRLLIFSSRCFLVLRLMFKYLIHFELIFCEWYEMESNFILLHVIMRFPQQYLFKDYSFSVEYSWSFVIYLLTVHARVYFGALDSVLLVYVHTFMQVTFYNYHIFICWNQEVGYLKLYYSLSGLLWLFRAFCGSIRI